MSHSADSYYVPHGSHWPIVASVSLTTSVVGAAMWFNGSGSGPMVMLIGLAMTLFMMYGWFGTTVRESLKGM
jgi:cytochrome c oxidase subunit 3